MQSYLGAHWDLVFLFETWPDDAAEIHPKDPFVKAAFHQVKELPREEIAEDHLEVIDGMLNSSADTESYH